MLSKRFAALLILLACLAGFSTACDSSTTSRRGLTPTPVPTLVHYEPAIFTVERGPIVAQKSITGEIVPSKQDVLFFRTNGSVSRITVNSGALVKKGDLLAELQVDDVLNQLQQARIDLSVAQAALEKAKTDRVYAADKAKIDLEVAKMRRDLAKLEVNSSTTYAARTRAQLNLNIAEQNLQLAELNLKMTGDTSNLKEEQVVERQKLAVQRLELLLSERQIVAPYDGVILRVMISAGNPAVAFNNALEIGDPAELVIRTQSDSTLEPLINRDTEVLFSFSATSKELKKISYMPDFIPFSNLADTKQQAMMQDWMYFSIPTGVPREQLKIGMSVSLDVIIGRHDNVLTLKPAAIRSYRGLSFVIVQDGELRRRVEISKIGLQTVDKWEIEAELKEGDRVIGQ